MKLKHSWALILLLSLPLIAGSKPVRASNGVETTLYVDPPLSTAMEGETFFVDIMVADVERLYAWQVNITYGPDVLQFVNVTEGDFLASQAPDGTWTVPPAVKEGEALFGWAIVGAFVGPSGDGWLGTIEFEVVGDGETVLNISHPETYLIEYIPPPPPPGKSVMEEIPHTRINGYFRTEVPIPDFQISVDPSSLTIRQGSLGTSTIAVTSLIGFEGVVDLTVSGAPASVATTLDPTSVTLSANGSQSSTLAISVDVEAAPGLYTLTVTGTSGDLLHSTYLPLEITPLPPPNAIFTYSPGEPSVFEPVTFDASASYDPDGTIISYEWDLGDGSVDTGMSITHTFSTVGTYSVVLTVTDNDGKFSTSTHSLTVTKLPSTISITLSATTVYVNDGVTIGGSITPARPGATATIWYRLTGQDPWAILVTVATEDASEYSYTWLPSEIGSYELKAAWLGDVNTFPAESLVEPIDVIALPTLFIELAGELDYSCKEEIPIRLSALVTDTRTLEAVSGANVTVEIYDPKGILWTRDNMTERQFDTGIYEWESNATICELKDQKQLLDGVYLVHVKASYRGGPVTSDILEYHVDSPGDETAGLSNYCFVAAALASIIAACLILLRQPLRGLFRRSVQ